MPNVKLDKLKSSATALRFMCDIKQEESHVSHVILLSCVALDLKSEEQSQYNLQIVETKAVYAE